MTATPADLRSVRTLADLLAWRVTATPDAEAYRHHDQSRDDWVGTSWRNFGERVARFARAMAASGVSRGARIAVLLPNGLDAVSVDQAALALACAPVPMHAIDNPASIAYILADSEAELLVADNEAQWQAIVATGAVPASLRHVVLCQCDAAAVRPSTPTVQSLDDWLVHGDASPAASAPGPAEDELAALVYTSGTTGKPKGVMLTHANVLANVKAIMERLPTRGDDVYLSFLPLSHTFERTCGYYLPVATGACVAFSRSVAQLPQRRWARDSLSGGALRAIRVQ